MNETMQQNQGDEAKLKKAKLFGCLFSAAMALLCLSTLFFPIVVESLYYGVNGFDLLSFVGFENFANRFEANEFLAILYVLFTLFVWLQFIFSAATIIISVVAISHFGNKQIKIIAFILPIISLAFIFLYMLQSIIIFAVGKQEELSVIQFLPFVFGLIVFVVGLVLGSKNKMPVENVNYNYNNYSNANNYSNENNYSNANMNNNYIDAGAANVGGGENCSNANDGGLLSESQIQTYLMSIKSNVPNESLGLLNQQLHRVSQSKMSQLAYLPMKSPTTILLMSIFLGAFGVDRFMLGDIGIGVCKLLFSYFTLGIWPLVDIFMCYKKVKEKNLEDIMMCITNNRI